MGVSIKDFPDWKKHTDTLIKIFNDQGWIFGKEIPDIVFSDKLVPLPENKNGLHGSGILKSEDNDITFLLSDYKKKDSGFEIIIYTKVLETTAKELENFDRFSYKEGLLVDKRENLHFIQENGNTPDYGMDFQEARENLFYCALLNETAKWILIDVVDVNGNIWKESPLDKKDHLHECLTALFIHWVVNSDKNIDLTKTFNWVFNKLHNGNYAKYKDFLNENIGDFIDATEIARVENFHDLEIFKPFCEKNINFANYQNSSHRGKLLKGPEGYGI